MKVNLVESMTIPIINALPANADTPPPFDLCLHIVTVPQLLPQPHRFPIKQASLQNESLSQNCDNRDR